MSVAVVLLAFWLPGLAVGAAIRLRGWTLAAGAPALTFGLVALGAVVIGNLGVRWSLASFGIWVAAVTAVCLAASTVLTKLAGRRTEPAETTVHPEPERPTRWHHVLVGAGVASGVVVGVVTFLRGVSGLGTLNQDWDAPFHANAVRWIAEHGNPLPSALGPIANLPDKSDYFYPNTYHALLALLWGGAGVDMAPLLNLAALAGVIAFPLGVAALGLAWRMPPVAVAVAAAVSTWFSTFPYDSLWRGPLWPFVAGVALVPATLAIARHVIAPRGLAGPVGLPLAAAGLAGLHTSLAFVLFGYALVLLVALVLRLEPVRWRSVRRPAALTAVIGGVLLAPVVLPAISGAGITAARWPEVATPSEAFGQVLLVSPVVSHPQWWIGLPALVGFVLLILHRQMLWMVGAYLLFGALYAACASLDTPLVNRLTGPFYNDSWRLAALLALGGALAVGYLAHATGGLVATWLGRLRAVQRPVWLTAAPVVCAALIVAVLGVLSNGAYVPRNSARLAIQYHDGPTVSSGERAAYDWIAQRDPHGTVMNDRSDGSVWMYALTGLRPVEWTFYGNEAYTDPGVLTARLNKLGEDPEVEQAVAELGVRYVVIGDGFVRANGTRSPGLTGLWSVPGLRKVYSNDDATVYEVIEHPEPSTR